MVIIETIEDFEGFRSQLGDRNLVIFPLFHKDTHPNCDIPVLMIAKNLRTQEIYVLPHSHCDCLPFFDNFDFLNSAKCIVLDKKYLNAPNCMDLEAMLYSTNSNITLNIRSFYQEWSIEPLYKIIDSLDEDFIQIEEFCLNFVENDAFTFLNDVTLHVLGKLEKSGVKVNRDLFKKYFEKESLICDNDFVFTQYNYLTATGRPSNRFGGVNYSALNKNDESREVFISRFDGGKLFMLDYDSYHPRLISKLIGVEVPMDSLHTYFGQMYFGKQELTEEEYNESKRITFRLIYGNIPDEYKHIEFFNKIDNFINVSWEEYERNGFIESILSKIKIYADSKTKLFNYLIQNFETERNMSVLYDVVNIEARSKPILYTYDSVLFDVHPDETEYLDTVRNIMEVGGFKTKLYVGDTYNNMILLE